MISLSAPRNNVLIVYCLLLNPHRSVLSSSLENTAAQWYLRFIPSKQITNDAINLRLLIFIWRPLTGTLAWFHRHYETDTRHLYQRKNEPVVLLWICLALSCKRAIFRKPIDHSECWPTFEFSNQSLEIHKLLNNVRGGLPKLTNHSSTADPHSAPPTTTFEVNPDLRIVKIHRGFHVVLGS
ncbi:uncharacterized protein BT62DRAFT_1012048 [Guyanagaster necrorhizus]|uniref:Uncharacterized protein n=1 Tax=Guyanagaster necrorhizus TaxID=856835 RepID=A0A9P7VJ76_9AGAR|nr:uncharacterized protein BT62DRAFT_1012048 [Guyanagaster necrorhizus MCA 3950]KAG7441011.1 hypothetical protein BT62DRAFT_1012048 [Guyanagaster necrorhizus MCA 3950]